MFLGKLVAAIKTLVTFSAAINLLFRGEQSCKRIAS